MICQMTMEEAAMTANTQATVQQRNFLFQASRIAPTPWKSVSSHLNPSLSQQSCGSTSVKKPG